MIDMKPIVMDGRALLAFPHDGDARSPLVAAATQKRAIFGASRGNILKNWRALPPVIRHDDGFCGLMDHYHPMTEDEYKLRKAIDKEVTRDHLRFNFGGRTAELYDPNVLPDEEEVIRAIRSIPLHRAAVDYPIPFGGSTAISTSSTPKTIAGSKPRANQSVYMWGFDIGFDGTTSTNGPAIVELQQNTWATNGPGTNSTSVTSFPIDNGRPETIQSSNGKAWTTEPTVLTLWQVFFIPNYMGTGIVFQPLTKPFVMTGTIGGSMRITQQSSVTGNGTGSLKVQE